MSYQVRPRYTSGSPAMVNQVVACSVAAQERLEYARALSGVYGSEPAAEAERLGLDGIVEDLVEHRNHWMVRDLITGAITMRPFGTETLSRAALNCLKCRDARERALYERLREREEQR